MSVRTEIERLNAIKNRIRTNLVAQGVAVPTDTMLDEMATMILSVAGEDGKTPVKGVDYFTEADKAEIAAQVDGATLVQAPQYVDHWDKMTDQSRVYVLASTGHIWAYIASTRIEEVRESAGMPLTDDGRLGSDGTIQNGYAGYVATDYIDLMKYPLPFKLHFDGSVFCNPTGDSYTRLATYDANKAKIACGSWVTTNFNHYLNAGGTWGNTVEVDSATGFVTVTFNTTPTTNNGGALQYVRASGKGEPDTVDVYVTYNKEVTNRTWVDTKTTYAPTLTEAERQAMVDEVASIVDVQLLSVIGDGVVTT